ncbi:MAG: tyrosinase family protein [Myxococcota bacterium]
MKTRKDILTIEADPNDDTMLWYSRAVGFMKSLPETDHRSWLFQAKIHSVPKRERPLPPQMKPYWRQCQHGHWFIWPWHRIYLLHFESIVAKIIRDGVEVHGEVLKGPKDWTLPYWRTYQGKGGAGAVSEEERRRLPKSFRKREWTATETGTNRAEPNHLFLEDRYINDGRSFGERSVRTKDTLLVSGFENFGSRNIGRTEHLNLKEQGALEQYPHNSVHVAVGEVMADFDRSARDPSFYTHHCNLDRLWDVWVARSPRNENPTSRVWLEQRFRFKDVNGNDHWMTPREVVKTAELGYLYEDVSDPVPSAEAQPPARFAASAPIEPTMIGVADAALEVPMDRGVTATSLPLEPRYANNDPESTRYVLHIEHMTSDTNVGAFDVYVGVPAGADDEERERHFVGRVSPFGIAAASDTDDKHGGAGLSSDLDVTEAVEALADRTTVPIDIRPVRPAAGDRMRIGRLSLYAQ